MSKDNIIEHLRRENNKLRDTLHIAQNLVKTQKQTIQELREYLRSQMAR